MQRPALTALTEEVVAEFLADNPDFFLKRQGLVERLSLPNHEQGAVSLVSVQLKRQRARIEALEEEISELMAIATGNDNTFQSFMDLQAQVLKCTSAMEVIERIREHARLLNLSSYVGLIDNELVKHRVTKSKWQQFSKSHLNGKDAFLGRLKQQDRHLLFEHESLDISLDLGSYVVLPLYSVSSQKELGFLAFSSMDGGHFQPHQDTLFLRHLALTVAHLLSTLPLHKHSKSNGQRSF